MQYNIYLHENKCLYVISYIHIITYYTYGIVCMYALPLIMYACSHRKVIKIDLFPVAIFADGRRYARKQESCTLNIQTPTAAANLGPRQPCAYILLI